ncbi:hypothetical protein [Xanthobacter autotrophicus]|uniref:hypothetical protein n=1 Tax=Xanthobacter autotrophicus TaxID=280 RepID=UPI0024A62A63|nr:hypothetical protein [Xanthobacter autotrophicus]MDI4657525.1 hypothetical protein [Xanthobacter autotrophicus]
MILYVRGTLKEGDWVDEIHGTSSGFAKAAAEFGAVIAGAIWRTAFLEPGQPGGEIHGKAR